MSNMQQTVSINENDILYRSNGQSPDIGRYPIFFTINDEIANTYARLIPGNQCIKYINDKKRTLLTLGANTEEINRMLRSLPDQALARLLNNILNVFFAKANNIEDVLTSIDKLFLEITFIESIITYHISYPAIYAGYNKTVISDMIQTLNMYKSKLLSYSGEKMVIPSRTTDRNFDMFLCNCLKMSEFIGLDGIFYQQIDLPHDRDYITQNEVVHDIANIIVPTEICLFEGYNYITRIGLCHQHGGRKRS